MTQVAGEGGMGCSERSLRILPRWKDTSGNASRDIVNQRKGKEGHVGSLNWTIRHFCTLNDFVLTPLDVHFLEDIAKLQEWSKKVAVIIQ